MIRFLPFAAAALAAAPALAGQDPAPMVRDLLASGLGERITAPVVIEAIRARNAETAGLDAATIEARDQAWRAEVGAGGGAMIDAQLSSAASAHLVDVMNAEAGLISEIFVMDAQGLNVAQSGLTSDYWQGDEDKFRKSFGAGADALFVDAVEFDESAQALLSQASFTVADPDTGAPIGAVTVGVNVEMLAQ